MKTNKNKELKKQIRLQVSLDKRGIENIPEMGFFKNKQTNKSFKKKQMSLMRSRKLPLYRREVKSKYGYWVRHQ